jgi:hypothetical protein
MSRLDYSPLGRKFETLDAGFTAYCGFIQIEVHPPPNRRPSYIMTEIPEIQIQSAHVTSQTFLGLGYITRVLF